MHPILFSIGPLVVYSYGFMLAAAFLVTSSLAGKRAHIFAMSKEYVYNQAFIIIVSGIIGARLFYILLNIDYFIANPLESFMVNRGGLIFYGGLFTALIAGVIFAKVSKVSVLDTADLFAPFVTLGHSIGRIGCLLNGCCYGKRVSPFLESIFPWKAYPTQLFCSVGLFLVFLMLFYLQPKRRFRGQVFFVYLITYGLFRFLIEFLRGDLSPVFYGLTITQVISIVLSIVGIYLYFVKRHKL
jgi:phosphatidylglycerol:prolipoprotein diacylglycerol transferase